MLRFDIISVVPDLLSGAFEHSILKRAQESKLLEVVVHDLRDYSEYKRRQVDDYQYGGGAGMVLMAEPIWNCVEKLKSERSYDEVIFMAPDGALYDQSTANKLSLGQNYIILCGHYKGVDQRVRDHIVTMEISIGDYVLSGGELAAAVVVDSVARIIPGVINDETSALSDSFQDGLLSAPVYTRPEEVNGWKVPDLLLGGNHAEIEKWRNEKSIEKTKKIRPDLWKD